MLSEWQANINASLEAMGELVARLYRQPVDEGTAAFLRDVDLDDPDDLFLSDPACSKGIAQMKAFFETGSLEDRLHEASADFHRLFVGPLKLLAAPWSSVYMDLGSLFGPTALAVEGEFKRWGLVTPEGNHEPFDHIGYEFAFLAEMHRGLAADPAGPEVDQRLAAGKAFVGRFMEPWVGALCDRIGEGARTPMYQGLAELTRGLLAWEGRFFGAFWITWPLGRDSILAGSNAPCPFSPQA